ncbi:bifunctional DNA-formamidopyrimidine glycosylase/DNA-(apurinic or apyrimidinic site) lyase [Thiolinea disciformis]|uniref:bifunctional DNA-formamidopyrimidine glycosylase/DNA-(apurinic or apyrimidinic site) lyase n=1 Tax=Thiolinea disciformis TaxID=125614 RepID=UPI00036401E6|nr:bifunctional DNA-formamidopyrimidine glycosylase/DNA-(apurinic or apyrimidinic site) lyase [Thiolinea disciformis]
MPELPEVETTRLGIAPHLLGRRIEKILVRQARLRWPIPASIALLEHSTVLSVQRRAKYLLVETEQGSALLHLGMSGSLRISSAQTPPEKHDHVDFVLDNAVVLRLRDPRKFGAVLFCHKGEVHPLLAKLGPEPLTDQFTGDYLYKASRKRNLAIKAFVMDAHQVVGVGNIYANEALFMAGIHPARAAASLTELEAQTLVNTIKVVLARAIEKGGTTLRDFVREDGQTGYFQQVLQVYGRTGEACFKCHTPIEQIRQGQRSTWYCPSCQPLL